MKTLTLFPQGDWKISGLGLTISLSGRDGGAPRWEYPGFDGRALAYTQRSFDYIGTRIYCVPI